MAYLWQMLIFRSRTCALVWILVPLLLLGGAPVCVAREINEAQQCPALPHPYPSNFSADWNSDVSYDVVEGGKNLYRHLTFTGDRLLINRENFGSLIRDVDQAGYGISELTLDAREVVVESALVFDSAKITIRARRVIFRGNGQIALTGPTSALPDGLFIIAETVEFQKSVSVPFLLHPTPALASQEKRSLSIQAKFIKIDDVVIDNESGLTAVWSRTLGSVFEDTPQQNDAVMVETGELGEAAFIEATATASAWPAHFIKKIGKFHARGPYDESARKLLLGQIAENEVVISKSANPQLEAQLREVRSNLHHNLDGFGQPQSFVPRESLFKQIERLDIARKEKDYFAFLEEMILQRPADMKDLEDKLLPLRSDIAAAAAETEQLEPQLRAALSSVSLQESEIREVLVRIEGRKAQILQEQEKKAGEKKAKLAAAMALQKVGMVASLVPHPVAQGIATGANAASALVSSEDDGKIDFEKATFTFEDLKKGNEAFRAKVDFALKAFDSARSTKTSTLAILQNKDKKAEDKINSTKEFLKSSSEFSESLSAVYNELNLKSAPTTLDLAKAEKEDMLLMRLLDELANARSSQGEAISTVIKLRSAVEQSMNRSIAAAAKEREVLEFGEIKNDADTARWRALALTLWQSHFTDLYTTAVRLRRSFLYETGVPPAVPADALYYPDEGISYIRSGLFDPMSAEKAGASKESLRKELATRRDRFLFFAGTIVAKARIGYEAYLAKRTSADQINIPTVYDLNEASKGNNSRFLRNLNSEIAKAIVIGRKSTPSIPMPVDFPASDSPYPLKYLGAQITAVRFAPDSAKGFQFYFRILHPGIGIIRRDGLCFAVDTRERGASSVIVRTTEVPPQIHELDNGDRDSIRKDVNGIAFYALAPADATYSIKVDIVYPPSVASPPTLPKIERMRSVIKVMQ